MCWLRFLRLARCRPGSLALIQRCCVLRMPKPGPIVTSGCDTLAQSWVVSLGVIPSRQTDSRSETSCTLAFTARQHLANQLDALRRDNGFSSSLRLCCRAFWQDRARCAVTTFRLRRKFRFCRRDHQFAGRADGRIFRKQPRFIWRIVFATHCYHSLNCSSALPLVCKRPNVPFPRKTVFSHPSHFQLWDGWKNRVSSRVGRWDGWNLCLSL